MPTPFPQMSIPSPVKHISIVRALLAPVIALSTAAHAANAQDLLWTSQFGTDQRDLAMGLAVDSAGNTYMTGATQGSLAGPNAGDRDAAVVKFDASGAVLWTRQFGAYGPDQGLGVAVDGAGGTGSAQSIYVTGSTWGSLGGQQHVGKHDAFVAKFDAAGSLLWTRQFGTQEDDGSFGVAVDRAGNVYVAGTTEGSLGGPNAGGHDLFVTKFDVSGTVLWTRQFGSAEADIGFDMALDSADNVYITGYTTGDLGGPNAGGWDVIVAKLDASGTALWTRQIGSIENELANGIEVDSAGNAYISGWTNGNLGGQSAGGRDAFAAKFDAAGTLLWMRQFGTQERDQAQGVAVDVAGNASITGTTEGSLGGPNAGGDDIFLATLSTSGTLLSTRQFGTSDNDRGSDVAVDNAGSVYITGETYGSLGGPQLGRGDYFLAKFSEALCYADCDQSTGAGVLDMLDFVCFQNSFVSGEPYACDCDTTTGPLVCDLFDFLCFQDAFVAGCP